MKFFGGTKTTMWLIVAVLFLESYESRILQGNNFEINNEELSSSTPEDRDDQVFPFNIFQLAEEEEDDSIEEEVVLIESDDVEQDDCKIHPEIIEILAFERDPITDSSKKIFNYSSVLLDSRTRQLNFQIDDNLTIKFKFKLPKVFKFLSESSSCEFNQNEVADIPNNIEDNFMNEEDNDIVEEEIVLLPDDDEENGAVVDTSIVDESMENLLEISRDDEPEGGRDAQSGRDIQTAGLKFKIGAVGLKLKIKSPEVNKLVHEAFNDFKKNSTDFLQNGVIDRGIKLFSDIVQVGAENVSPIVKSSTDRLSGVAETGANFFAPSVAAASSVARPFVKVGNSVTRPLVKASRILTEPFSKLDDSLIDATEPIREAVDEKFLEALKPLQEAAEPLTSLQGDEDLTFQSISDDFENAIDETGKFIRHAAVVKATLPFVPPILLHRAIKTTQDKLLEARIMSNQNLKNRQKPNIQSTSDKLPEVRTMINENLENIQKPTIQSADLLATVKIPKVKKVNPFNLLKDNNVMENMDEINNEMEPVEAMEAMDIQSEPEATPIQSEESIQSEETLDSMGNSATTIQTDENAPDFMDNFGNGFEMVEDIPAE